MSKKNKPAMILKAIASFGTSSASAELKLYDRYDFIPVVTINEDEKGENIIYSTEECTECNKDKLDLGEGFTENLQDYLVPEIVIAKNSVSKIPLKILQGHDPFGFQDNDGIVEFSSSNSKVTIMPKSKKVSYGDKIEIEIKHTLGRGEKFSIDIKGKDDDDDNFESSDTIVISGKLNISVIDKDVFMEDEAQRGIDDILFVEKQYEKRPSTGEYSINYCIQSADRFLGKVVENTTNFYTYDDTANKRIYTPSLENAIIRAKKIKTLGYGKIFKEFDGSIFALKEEKVKDKYGNNPSRILSLKANNGINDFFNQQVSNRIGFHIFYLSIVEGFHTLIIVVDNTEPCSPKYEIYDEEGLSSSKGALNTIADGILGQSQWVYSWAKPRYGYWAKLRVSILKFQRK
ncbi:hypothetical protein G1L01_13295 [Tenacibaculum finnmarkense]|uniref:Uncharacterized protein n=1 Tax=Tenacibaculum finnmarkense genomovar finnmarkense TaxID=1458503 RepID=A0AAP1WHD2_9FLAO|nr:hypothetical protein [Tenacibaculum finnmarkense]MBE7654007.1 hypothetical protein [Tenacibaculum finnmarkense genomovar finnmarkense]MBE7696306.1 hypothetical protein [Tenacibaculum finnmarkense genomovar finnmarkense]MCD8428554.1 hypothetical protein [Tenacibaculum finnmarkense genomovar finnmarkense]MCG8203607.1 hypothetical protein [Tenacibaculum finnmarkense genomovar finnmarkense]MCG8732280.1 hypothetical protein [Tenacibaculum finnmarkense]